MAERRRNLTTGLERVKAYLSSRSIAARVVIFATSTKNSKLAAESLGCTLGEIAKTIVFTGEKTVVVILSGDKRVNTTKLAGLVGTKVRVASAEEVMRLTGYAVGGVPPFPHNDGIAVYPDISLTKYARVWAAAGEQNAVMQLSVGDLLGTVGTPVADIST